MTLVGFTGEGNLVYNYTQVSDSNVINAPESDLLEMVTYINIILVL